MSELREAIEYVEGQYDDAGVSVGYEQRTVLAAARKYADLKDMVAKGARVVVEYPCEHGYFSRHLVSGERCAGGVPWQAMPEWCSCVPGDGGIMDVEGCPTHDDAVFPDG